MDTLHKMSFLGYFFKKIFKKPLDKIPSPWYNMQAL